MIDPDKRFFVWYSERFRDSFADQQGGDKAWFTCRCKYVYVCDGDFRLCKYFIDESEYMVRMQACGYFWNYSLSRNMLDLCMRPHWNELFISQKGYRGIVTGWFESEEIHMIKKSHPMGEMKFSMVGDEGFEPSTPCL